MDLDADLPVVKVATACALRVRRSVEQGRKTSRHGVDKDCPRRRPKSGKSEDISIAWVRHRADDGLDRKFSRFNNLLARMCRICTHPFAFSFAFVRVRGPPRSFVRHDRPGQVSAWFRPAIRSRLRHHLPGFGPRQYILRPDLLVVAISMGFGMIPPIAPNFHPAPRPTFGLEPW